MGNNGRPSCGDEKKELSQEIVLNADLNVALLTEEFLYSFT